MPRKAPAEPTRRHREIVAKLAADPAFRNRKGWRIRGGEQITAATGALLHAFGLVALRRSSRGTDMMVLTAKGHALNEGSNGSTRSALPPRERLWWTGT